MICIDILMAPDTQEIMNLLYTTLNYFVKFIVPFLRCHLPLHLLKIINSEPFKCFSIQMKKKKVVMLDAHFFTKK